MFHREVTLRQPRGSRHAFAPLLLLVLGTTGCIRTEDGIDHGRHLVRVAGVFPTPIDEPWPRVVDQAFRAVAASHGIEYEAEYGVGEEHFEEALRRAAGAGHDIVVADSFADEAAARRIAAEHPQVHFFLGSGLGPAAPNTSVFDSWLHEAAYLAGMVAGSATRSHRIGVVAAMPGPETNRLLSAFRAGALEMNPASCLAVAYTGTWFDPAAAAEAGRRLIATGADVIYAERLGAEGAAAAAGVPVIGNFLDQRARAPEVTLTSVLWDMRPAVEHLVRQVEHEKYHDHSLDSGAGATDAHRVARIEDYAPWSSLVLAGSGLAPWADVAGRFGAEAQAQVETSRQLIIDGLFRVPIVEVPVPECNG